MRLKYKILCLVVCLISLFSFSNAQIVFAKDKIYLGGYPAGFSLQTRGANIIGICDVITETGVVSPSKDAGLTVGDIVIKIDDNQINNAQDIERVVISNNLYKIEYIRDGEQSFTTIKPAKDLSNKYRLGIYVRDKINGIGTVTYIKNNRIASLGHPVLNEQSNLIDIVGGDMFNCEITGFIKGERGRAGELRGTFDRRRKIASLDKNLNSGVYGDICDNENLSNLREIELGNAKMGDASIYTTINGTCPKEYSISIIKVDTISRDTKNFVIRITDQRLLELTGGIVQGMSGSPIVQNGKLVGAVTHVFINDPTRGFGISIDNMINN